MERKILFKAKKLSDGKWVKGDLLHKGNKTYIYFPHINEKGIWVENEQVDPSTVCQFTGLKDKDGVEIWEGDYLSSIHGYPKQKKVEFKNGSFGLDMYYRGLDFVPLACCDIRAGKLAEFELVERKEGEA